MTPYYSDEFVTIYHGDCLTMLDEIEADVLVTDPPYGIDWKKGAGIGVVGSRHRGIANDSDTSARDAVLGWWGDRPWVVFGSLKVALPANWKQALVFHKDCAHAGLIGIRRPWLNNWEPIFVGGVWPDQTPRLDSVIATCETSAAGYHGYATRAGHPHAKPVDVMAKLILAAPDGVILDTFAGSGSTLRAAKDLGRRAIGIEAHEPYCEIAAKRCAQEVLVFG